MKLRRLPNSFLYSIVMLVLAALLVQSVYALVIRPEAAAIIAEQQASMKADPSSTSLRMRSPYVILKDYEQEVAIILALWSFAMLGYQWLVIGQNRRLLQHDFVGPAEGRVILPEDVRAYSRPMESLPREEQDMLLPRALLVALNRFGATSSVHDAAESVRDECEFESTRLDAGLSMVRFTAWAIPAVGFVGTVRGIGESLQEAQRALGGDITGVTSGLGVAFNSTLIALILSIMIMFLLHQLQQAQDRVVLETKLFVDRTLIRRLRSPAPSTSALRAAAPHAAIA